MGDAVTETAEKTSGMPDTEETAGKRASIRQEKEKVLDQLSKAGQTRTGGTQQIRGINQATRDEKREIYSDGGIIPLGEELQFKSEGQKLCHRPLRELYCVNPVRKISFRP